MLVTNFTHHGGRSTIAPYRADGARPETLALPAGHPKTAATVAPGIPTAVAISAMRLPWRASIKIWSILSRVACILRVYDRTPRNATKSGAATGRRATPQKAEKKPKKYQKATKNAEKCKIHGTQRKTTGHNRTPRRVAKRRKALLRATVKSVNAFSSVNIF